MQHVGLSAVCSCVCGIYIVSHNQIAILLCVTRKIPIVPRPYFGKTESERMVVWLHETVWPMYYDPLCIVHALSWDIHGLAYSVGQCVVVLRVG